MSRIPGMKALSARFLRARAAEPRLEGDMFPRMPEAAVYEVDAELGRSQPEDALMYLRLNVTRFRVDDFVSRSWAEIVELDLPGGRLPLLWRERDGTYVGCDTIIPRGKPGHLAEWREQLVRPLTPSTGEAFYAGLVEKLEKGEITQDPLRILGGLHPD